MSHFVRPLGNDIFVLVRLLGKCLGLLRAQVKEKKKAFQKALKKCGVKYNCDYANFLIRLSTLIDTYPRLLLCGMPVRWFKVNMRSIEIVCKENAQEWGEIDQHDFEDTLDEGIDVGQQNREGSDEDQVHNMDEGENENPSRVMDSV